MFTLNEGIVVLVRSLIAFFSLLIFTRFLGKQQVGQLTFFEYVLGITIGSIAATLSVDLSSRAWPHFVGLLTWTVTVFILQFFSVKSQRVAKYLVGEPTLLIVNGQIMEEAMNRIRYTIVDLMEQLRDKSVFDLNQVEFAVLEPSGKLSVLLKADYSPLTLRDMNISTKSSGLATQLIYDGIVIEQNLKKVNKDRDWLEKELKNLGISSPAQIFLFTIDDSETIYIDTYEDHIE